MTEERLIAGISVTPGGDPDGQELSGLIEKAKRNGIEVAEVIGDWHMSVMKIWKPAGKRLNYKIHTENTLFYSNLRTA